MTKPGYLITAGTAGMIDADAAGTTNFGTDGPPLAFFGSGRPDAAGLDLSSPVGSTYTFTGDQSELDAVFGARMWRKSVTNWVCVEGETASYTSVGSAGRTTLCVIANTGFKLIQYEVNFTAGETLGTTTTPVSADGLESEWLAVGNALTIFSTTSSNPTIGPLDGITTCASKYVGYAKPNLVIPDDGARSFGLVPALTKQWPSSITNATPTTVYLRELIEAAESPDHPNHDQLMQLKEELANLTGTKPGDDK